jgi:adenosine deaminase
VTTDAVRDLRALPKAHLHLHLEAAMRRETFDELAAERGLVPPSWEFDDFSSFTTVYTVLLRTLDCEGAIRRLVREVVEDAVREGVVYIEPSLHPPLYAGHFPHDEYVEIVLGELEAAGADLGVATGVQILADRTASREAAEELACLATSFAGRGVVTFGRAGDERGHRPDPFARAFAIAAEAGLCLAPHAGELAGPESVQAALDVLGAHRIQHGVRAIESPELIDRLASDRICLDVCPTSNVALSVVPRLEDHPLPALRSAGIPCTLNADDPLLFGVSILDEYERARVHMTMSDAELAELARTSIMAARLPESSERSLLAQISAWLMPE